MGLLKNIYADFRQMLGFEPELNALERKIKNVNKDPERALKKQQYENQIVIDEINYNMVTPKNDLAMLDQILKNIENIKAEALKDIKLYSSGMESRVGYAIGNYAKLCTWLENTKRHINAHLYIDYKRQIEQASEIMISRYIDAVLTNGLQDNGKPAYNEKIVHLFQILQMDVGATSLSSERMGYQYIEEIRAQAEQKSRNLYTNIHHNEIEKSPYEEENNRLQYQLNIINNQRQALRNTLEYLEAQRQSERMKRG